MWAGCLHQRVKAGMKAPQNTIVYSPATAAHYTRMRAALRGAMRPDENRSCVCWKRPEPPTAGRAQDAVGFSFLAVSVCHELPDNVVEVAFFDIEA